MLVVAGKFVVAPSEREQLLTDWRERIPKVSEADGCLEVAVAADTIDDGIVRIFERWESRAHHDRHIEAMIRNGERPTVEREVVLYEVASAELSSF